MNDRQKKIKMLKSYYAYECVEAPMGSYDDFTSFDKEVLGTLDKLFDAHRDVTVTPECASLGFVLKSESTPGCQGCKTVPCFSGKMPYQEEPDTICESLPGVCTCSPMRMVEYMVADKQERETNDETNDATRSD